MNIQRCFQLLAASLGLLLLGGCATASSVTAEVRVQEAQARRALATEREETRRLLGEKSRLEGKLKEVQAAKARTPDPTEKARLQKQEDALNREIASLQNQLDRLSRN